MSLNIGKGFHYYPKLSMRLFSYHALHAATEWVTLSKRSGKDRLYNDSNLNFFTEKVTGYDKNGNIRSLQRYEQTSASDYGLIDNLTYTLDGNRLNRVDDASGTAAYNGGFEFKDGVKQADEYAYDANGNLTKDLNKGIGSIQYNCLNLPTSVGYSSGGFSQFNCKAITGRD